MPTTEWTQQHTREYGDSSAWSCAVAKSWQRQVRVQVPTSAHATYSAKQRPLRGPFHPAQAMRQHSKKHMHVNTPAASALAVSLPTMPSHAGKRTVAAMLNTAALVLSSCNTTRLPRALSPVTRGRSHWTRPLEQVCGRGPTLDATRCDWADAEASSAQDVLLTVTTPRACPKSLAASRAATAEWYL